MKITQEQINKIRYAISFNSKTKEFGSGYDFIRKGWKEPLPSKVHTYLGERRPLETLEDALKDIYTQNKDSPDNFYSECKVHQAIKEIQRLYFPEDAL